MSYSPRAALPDRVLRRSDVQDALSRRDFGRVFALARKWGGISYSAIAESCEIKPERVGVLARGRGSITSHDKILQIADGLRIPGHFLGLLPRPWEDSETVVARPNAGEAIRSTPSSDGAGVDLNSSANFSNAGTRSLYDRALSLSFTHGDLRESLGNAQALWQTDVTNDAEIRHAPVSAEEITAPVLRWLVAPPALLGLSSSEKITVSADDVAAVRRACHLFEALDHEFGGGHARSTAVQYLHSEVVPLLRGNYTTAMGSELFAATSHFSYKVGAMAYDAALHGLARRYFMQALNFAHLASDAALAGKALALMSHQANFLGDYRSAVDFARSAKAGTGKAVTPGVYAMYSAMEARGLASLGEERECTVALTEMEQGFGKRGSEEPEWLDYFDEAEVHDEFAHCFHDLGRARTAADHAHRATTLTRQEYRRSRTFAGLILASSHLIGEPWKQDVERACALAEKALNDAGTLRSARVHAYVRQFNERLTPYTKTTAVQEFRSQALSKTGLSVLA
ncbi:hypothetical protein [Salinactinospora qingdaonensis]|uniref:Uncharacterized protein n=1 Tax=Salinactinospora qingdaonensis TaxID=702744 RepID=A0ABP7GI64_9ACTN